VKAGKELGIAKLIAKLVDASTSADLEVREQGQRKIPSLKLELDGRDNPPRRVDTLREQGKLVIRIYGQHRSLKEVLGTYSENGFKSENSPQARASIAEIVSQQLAQYVVERESETYPERFGDAAKFFFRQQQLIASFIVAAQVGLIVQ
jgi:predicted Zn-dependent peptidase